MPHPGAQGRNRAVEKQRERRAVWPTAFVVASVGADRVRWGAGLGSASVSEFSGPWADGCPQLSGVWSWVVRAGGQ